MLIKRDAYQQAGTFDESLTACEDWDMWLRLTLNARHIGLGKLLVRYRVLPESMSGDPARMLSNRLAVLAKHRPVAPSTQFARAEAYAYRTATQEWLQAGDTVQAMACFRQAATRYPALLDQLETFYELALWDQPKGQRGDVRQVDIDHNGVMLIEFLETFFSSPDTPSACQGYRAAAFGRTYQALALLSYARRDMRRARHHFQQSLLVSPSQIARQDFALPMVRTIVGPLALWMGLLTE
jgi:tetratricopeptide (TPR) repeat protein